MPTRTEQHRSAAIIAMAGLPGTGKSTLARALSQALNGIILDKDHVRDCLFPGDLIAYHRVQDDLCVDIMLQVSGYLLAQTDHRPVILDGRTYSRRNQVEPVVEATKRLGVPLIFIECQCREEIALRRIASDQSQQTHPAGNRDADLYRRIRARRELLDIPHLTVDTERSLDACLSDCLAYVKTQLASFNDNDLSPNQEIHP
jgi:adenylylsulfate kinase